MRKRVQDMPNYRNVIIYNFPFASSRQRITNIAQRNQHFYVHSDKISENSFLFALKSYNSDVVDFGILKDKNKTNLSSTKII